MNITRRKLLVGAAVSAASLMSHGQRIIRSSIGARGTIASVHSEEELYKELYEGFVTNTFPEGYELIYPYHTFRNYMFTQLDVDTLTFSEMTSQDFYGNSKTSRLSVSSGTDSMHVRVLKFPRFSYWGYYWKAILNGVAGLEHLYIPNVSAFQDTAHGFNSYSGTHLYVHIEASCEDIKGFPYFPGFSSSSLSLDKVSFLGTDGELAYDNELGDWVVTEGGKAFGWDIEYSS